MLPEGGRRCNLSHNLWDKLEEALIKGFVECAFFCAQQDGVLSTTRPF